MKADTFYSLRNQYINGSGLSFNAAVQRLLALGGYSENNARAIVQRWHDSLGFDVTMPDGQISFLRTLED